MDHAWRDRGRVYVMDDPSETYTIVFDATVASVTDESSGRESKGLGVGTIVAMAADGDVLLAGVVFWGARSRRP